MKFSELPEVPARLRAAHAGSRFARCVAPAAVAVAFGAGSASAATLYSISAVGLINDDPSFTSEASGLNNRGQVVGTIFGPDRYVDGFVDSRGTVSDFTVNALSFGQSINDAGSSVGYANSHFPPNDAWLRGSSGSVKGIGSLGGNDSQAFAISNSGFVTGASFTAGGDNHAFRYDGTAMKDLGTLGGSFSVGNGINNGGQVTGQAATQDGSLHAFVSGTNGTAGMKDLGTLGGATSAGRDINNAGQVTGVSALANGTTEAFLYSGGKMQGLGSIGGLGSVGYGINAGGQVTGALTEAFGVSAGAFVYSNGVMTNLSTVLDPKTGKGWTLLEGRDINDLGQIVGNGIDPSGRAVGFLLTPEIAAAVPEPGSLALITAGLGAIVLRARRRRRG